MAIINRLFPNHFLVLLSGQENLRQYVDRIFSAITSSGVSCPTVMCDIFFSLRESAASRFQGERSQTCFANVQAMKTLFLKISWAAFPKSTINSGNAACVIKHS